MCVMLVIFDNFHFQLVDSWYFYGCIKFKYNQHNLTAGYLVFFIIVKHEYFIIQFLSYRSAVQNL